MPDLEISQLPELFGPGLQTTDAFPLADLSASETKKITAKNLIQAGVALIDDSSIPYAKVDVPDVTIPDGAVTTDKIADGAVTDIKIQGVNGSKLVNGSVSSAKLGDVTDRGLDQADGKIGITNEVTASSSAGISWNAQGLVTGAVSPIPAPDLPIATPTVVGAVSVPADGGLSVSNTGEVSITYRTTADSVSNIIWNEFGNIVEAGPLRPEDLPIATTDSLGVAQFPGQSGIIVDADGNVSLSQTGATPGVWTKFTVDAFGRITSCNFLDPSDIPNINANKITAGQLPGGRIADRTITEEHLADYSTCLIQEGQPSDDYKLGQLWFTPSTNQLRVYGRGSGQQDLWLSVGFGALQQANLRWGGTVDASTSSITSVTSIGVSEGLEAGQPIPNATDELSGLYFVVETEGNAITLPNVNGDLCTPGDWVLCVDEAQGYLHIDVSAGGGGGGAQRLNDLTDVSITVPEAGDILVYDPITGTWKNTLVVDGGSF